MAEWLPTLERIARNAINFTHAEFAPKDEHPFDQRNFHACLPAKVRELFDDGHYTQASFEAFKFVDSEVRRLAGVDRSGKALMMEAFKDASPLIQLTPLATTSDRDEQEGYRFLFAGSIMAIRNPRGHEHTIADTIEVCLSYIALASLLLARLDQAGYTIGV